MQDLATGKVRSEPQHAPNRSSAARARRSEGPAGSWPDTLAAPSALQETIHGPAWHHRSRVIRALDDSYLPPDRNQAARMNECARGVGFFIDPDQGKVAPWLSRCHDRLCPFCANARSRNVADDLAKILEGMKTPRLMVLTIKSVAGELRDQLTFLRRSFGKLRRRSAFHARVKGGAYTVEVTVNPKSRLWHPHLHIIFDGEYFPQRLLRHLWHDVTGSAEIVWVSAVKDAPGMARELAKYIGKVQRIDDLDDDQIREYARSVRGARMVQTFGDRHGCTVKDVDDNRPDAPAEYHIKLSRIVSLARAGYATPQKLALAIAARWTIFADYIYHAIPQLTLPKDHGSRYRRLIEVLHGRPPPPQTTIEQHDARERDDVRMFLTFSRMRHEEAASAYFRFDETQHW